MKNLPILAIVGLVGIGGALYSAMPPSRQRLPLQGSKRPQPLPLVATEHLGQACALLDDSRVRALMSGSFETTLLIACGRQHELGGVVSESSSAAIAALGTDVLVNNPAVDLSGTALTQSETSIARNPNIGALCAAYNDSYSGVTLGTGFTGFSHSANNGASWVDHGVIPSGGGGLSRGDPSTVWSQKANKFYHASLHSSGLGLWNLTTYCQRATWLGLIHNGPSDDKEMMAVDNNTSSPYYGRLYVAWTSFTTTPGQIYITHSDNGTTWTTPVQLNTTGTSVQGAWPAVGPNGDVYVAWTRWPTYPYNIEIQVKRSTDGGSTFSFTSNPVSGKIGPWDDFATGNCVDSSGYQHPALNGGIRYSPFPQIAVDRNNILHVVYSYDPDGHGIGDVVNIYYRRSTDSGSTWGPEIRLNDDLTQTDQWSPSIFVNDAGAVGVLWYDRRDDPTGNYNFRYYRAASSNGGLSFGPNQPVSDVASPVMHDSNTATCYHGDYDTTVADGSRFYAPWSDDRNGNADVFLDTFISPLCGNGTRESGEKCDGADLGGMTCQSLTCNGGTLSCRVDCTLDDTACTSCQVASSEQTVLGFTSGNYTNTFISDDVREGVSTQLVKTTYRLIHTWTFTNIQSAPSHILHLEGFRFSSAPPPNLPDYQFEYSIDGGNSFTAINGAVINNAVDIPGGNDYSFGPSGLSGTVIIRLNVGGQYDHHGAIDHLYIRSGP